MLGRYRFRPVIFTSSALPFSTGVYTYGLHGVLATHRCDRDFGAFHHDLLTIFGLFGLLMIPWRLIRRSQRKNLHVQQTSLATQQAMLQQMATQQQQIQRQQQGHFPPPPGQIVPPNAPPAIPPPTS